MLKKLKKGFTLVELIVVIAIIAILSTVAVIGYTRVVDKANVSNDTQLVRNLNERMQLEEAATGYSTPETAHDAFVLTEDFGFIIEKLTPSSSGNDIVWDSTTNRFALIDAEDHTVVYSDPTKDLSGDTINLWKVFKEVPSETPKYSIYLAGENFTSPIKTSVGLDVGKNLGITEINYTNESDNDKNVVIRTNGGTLTINAPTDTVKHYGYAEILDIQAIAGASYHENGTSGFARIAQGHFVVESEGVVNVLYATGTKTGTTTVQVDNNQGVIGKAYATDDSVANTENDQPKQAGNVVLVKDESVTEEIIAAVTTENIVEEMAKPTSVVKETLEEVVAGSTFRTETDSDNITWNLISNINELQLFRDKVNAATSTDSILTSHFKLTNNIDLSSESNWTPISKKGATYHFQGTFDGNDKTISNLTISGNDDYVALFGSINGGTIKNVKLANAQVAGKGRAASLVAEIAGAATVDSCSNDTTSNVTGTGSNTGGLIAEIRCDAYVTISNCTNNASVTNTASSDSRAGGVVCQSTGFPNSSSTGKHSFISCVNNGTIKSNMYVGGVLCASQSNYHAIYMKDCANNDYNKLDGTYKGNLVGWFANGHDRRDVADVIEGYKGELTKMFGYLNANSPYYHFSINGKEYMMYLTQGTAGSTIFSQTATEIHRSYHETMDNYYNWVTEVDHPSFAGTANIDDYSWFILGLNTYNGEYFQIGAEYYLNHYNQEHPDGQLTIEDFKVTWVKDKLYVFVD